MTNRIHRPLELRDSREVYWMRQWVLGQIKAGRLEADFKAAQFIQTAEDAQKFYSRQLHPEQRRRLNKALSARRARIKSKASHGKESPAVRKVASEMTLEARNTLHAVATSRGITTSELILSTFGDEYDRLPK